MYASHFQIGYGDGKVDSNTHATALKEAGLAWDSPHRFDLVDLDQHVVPLDTGIQELLASATAGVSRWHAILLFRQSESQSGFFEECLRKITRAAKSTVIAL